MKSSIYKIAKCISAVIIICLTPAGMNGQEPARDYGDAPASYGTPSHEITDERIGALVDSEASSQPTEAADGDDTNGSDDEDGVTFPVMTRGADVTISISLSTPLTGFLSAWIDWNGDGDFKDPNERIANNITRASGSFGLDVRIPDNAIITQPTYARFRFGSKSDDDNSVNSGEVEDYRINILCDPPQAPVIGTITQPTCSKATGSVVLSGLPSGGTWKVTRTPGDVSVTGTGTSTTISDIPPGNYSFTVENALQCVSLPSENVEIKSQPVPPSAPLPGDITQPTCEVPTGSVVLSGLPSPGTWTIRRTPGNVAVTGTGTTTTVTGLPAGEYTFTVEISSDCPSPSVKITINSAPGTLSPPVVGTITQPDCGTQTGSVVLSELPATGSWTITRFPGNQTVTGTGASTTISGLPSGTYTFTVGDATHCTSGPSNNVKIDQQPSTPAMPTVGTVTQPTCIQSTGSVVLSGLPSGSWTINPGAVTGSGSSRTISGLATGSYQFTVTNSAGCTSPPTSPVVINKQPDPPASPVNSVDCSLGFNHAKVTVTSPHGDGMTYRIDNGSFQSSTVFEGVANGNHTITVRNADGCTTTGASFNVDCGCVNGPTVTLSVRSGITCSGSPITVEGNTFGGNATRVNITENGAGSVSPSSSDSSPFSFTYTPGAADAGRTVTITVATNNPLGSPCEPATTTYSLTVSQGPSAPMVGEITQPGCTTATGSVVLTGLPSGSWTLIRTPGDISTTGSGSTATIRGLEPGTYRYSVRDDQNCVSALSANVVIADQPSTPSVPTVGTIIQPTCTVATGSVPFSDLPSGTWTINPGAFHGSTRSATMSNVAPGTYNFTVTSSAGCVSAPTANVVINPQPPSPSAPVHNINCSLGFDHAVITVTSPLGEGYTYRLDIGQFQSSATFSDVVNGNHTITVRNSSGCTTTGSTFNINCGCVNGPSLALAGQTGTTCGVTRATLSGNTFGGNATRVTISENGAGSVSPSSSTTSPFSFTYTPAAGDAGRTVIITVTTDNPLGSPCQAATATYSITVNATPAAPSVSNVVHPSCAQPQGSVTLGGLPSSGTWTLTRSPDGNVSAGTGTSNVVTGLNPGTYSFTVTSAAGCTSASSANVVINQPPALPAAPVTGVVTHPTCNMSTGSVELTGLPEGSWTIVTNPGDVKTSGSGAKKIITGLVSGTYTFNVINSVNCKSPASQSVVINEQPLIPAKPVAGTITQPGCITPTGEIVLNNLPATGTWTLTRLPGLITTTGTGTGTKISGLAPGTYNFTVKSEQGCTSAASDNIVINDQPPTPTAPVIGSITAPTCPELTGSVELTGLTVPGSWTLTRQPGNVTVNGTGATTTVSGLQSGSYTFTVTSAAGCVSAASVPAVIPQNPSAPTVAITDPAPVCTPAMVNITATSITIKSTPGLTFTYWTDQAATIPLANPEAVPEGTYYIKGTTREQCFDVKPVNVRVLSVPHAQAGRDTTLEYVFFSALKAVPPAAGEAGFWTVLKGSGKIVDPRNPSTSVTGMSVGSNIFLWTVTNNVCPDASDTLKITVHDINMPTLLTPNNDGKNEYFILEGSMGHAKTEFSVFDRRGARVFFTPDYDNRWNGVDYNGKPLPDGTYFYVFRSHDGKSKSGFVVLRR